MRNQVVEVREAIRQGIVSASEQVAASRDRWKATHDWLNALVQPRFETAMTEAGEIHASDPRPLAGVPVSVKDCFAVRGLRTTLGILPRQHLEDDRDSEVVRRVRAAGGVIVGKGNVPQALYLHETDNPVFGRTLNPCDRARGPGGSSGGDAAAVAAGVVPLAFGNDLAGSIRQPAHACGLVGYLPSSRCLGPGGAFNTMPTLQGMGSRAGVLTRSVGDAVLAVEAVAGHSLSPTTAADPLPTVGWWDTAGPIPSSAAVVRGVRDTVARLEAAGLRVLQVEAGLAELAGWIHLALVSGDGGQAIQSLLAGSLPIPQVGELLRIAGMPRWQRPLIAGLAGLVGRRIESMAVRKTGPLSTDARDVVLRARYALDEMLVQWRGAEGIDAIVCPVSALPALRHQTAGRLILAAFPCLFASVLDLPAATVPVTRVRSGETLGRRPSRDPVLRTSAETDAGSVGLPIGVQVVALDGCEATLIKVIREIERTAGFELLAKSGKE
jgi:fatty acid amide hydrolase